MDSLTLYRADARGRINLTPLLDVEHYTAEKHNDGTITLSPVAIQTTSVKRASDTED